MKKLLPSLLTCLLALSACGVETDIKQQSANQVARPAFMVDRKFQSGDLSLQAWERMHQRNDVATVYLEGDSINMIDTNANLIATNLDLINPTPNMPLGLYLASRDKSKNLAYLSRPCQYLKMAEEKGCDTPYWQEKRFNPEVLTAYNKALNDIAARYDITGFHLIGYDGGANVAAILAAQRDDILSLRTVAGNLSPAYAEKRTNHNPLDSQAMMATDYGIALARIPQHHFIGGADDVITPAIYHSYRQALGPSECITYSVVQDADHLLGWVEKWPDLLQIKPQCPPVYDNLPALPPVDIDYPTKDLYKGAK